MLGGFWLRGLGFIGFRSCACCARKALVEGFRGLGLGFQGLGFNLSKRGLLRLRALRSLEFWYKGFEALGLLGCWG